MDSDNVIGLRRLLKCPRGTTVRMLQFSNLSLLSQNEKRGLSVSSSRTKRR